VNSNWYVNLEDEDSALHCHRLGTAARSSDLEKLSAWPRSRTRSEYITRNPHQDQASCAAMNDVNVDCISYTLPSISLSVHRSPIEYAGEVWLGVMYLRPPTIGHSLFEILLLSLFVIEHLHTSSFQFYCLLLPSSSLSKSYHGECVGSIDKDLVNFLHTERCGFGIEAVDRGDDTTSDDSPDKVEFPAKALETERGADCSLV
jgi:hypothetical protein